MEKRVERRNFLRYVAAAPIILCTPSALGFWHVIVPFIIKELFVNGIKRAATLAVGSVARKYALRAGTAAALSTKLALAASKNDDNLHSLYTNSQIEDFSEPDELIVWSSGIERALEITGVNPSRDKLAGGMGVILIDVETDKIEHNNTISIVLESQSAATFRYVFTDLPSEGHKHLYVRSGNSQALVNNIVVSIT